MLTIGHVRDKNIFIQINTASSRELKFVNLTALNTAIQNYPDLAAINPVFFPKSYKLYMCAKVVTIFLYLVSLVKSHFYATSVCVIHYGWRATRYTC